MENSRELNAEEVPVKLIEDDIKNLIKSLDVYTPRAYIPQCKVYLEGATKKLREIKRRYEIKLNPRDSSTSCGTQCCSYYSPETSSAQVSYKVPLPISSEYETQGAKIVKEIAPDEWDRIKNILRKIIENPYYAPPNSENEVEKKEFDEIKAEWEKIKTNIWEELERENIAEKVEEIRRKIEVYGEFQKYLDWLYDDIPSLFPPLIDEFCPTRILPSENARREICKYLENLREISNKEPSLQDYFTSIESTVKKIIEKYDSKSFKEGEIREKLSSLPKISQEIGKTLNTLWSQKYHLSTCLQNINNLLVNIEDFINSPPERRMNIIVGNLCDEAHEIAHGIFDKMIRNQLGIPAEKIYSNVFLHAINEGFAISYELYYILSQVEKGFLPPEAASYILIKSMFTCGLLLPFSSILYELLDDKKQHELKEEYKKIITYRCGCKLFGLEEIDKKVKSIDFSNPSQKELRTKVRNLKREIRRNIERVIGALKKNLELVLSEDQSNLDELIKKLYEEQGCASMK